VRRALLHGATAGAVGTLALDAVTYLDMAVTGRPPSDLPSRAAGQMADGLGLGLGDEASGEAEHRRTGIGALLGYATGLTVGALYGLTCAAGAAPRRRAARAVGVAVAATVAAGVPAAASGLTDPRRWTKRDWAADVFPHAGYGLATVLTYEALTRP
jgi:hypothetical protein